MGNFIVKDPPEYSDEMRTLETTDPDHADVFNELFGQLINNDAFLKKLADEIIEKAGELNTKVLNHTASSKSGVLMSQVGWYRICTLKSNVTAMLDISRHYNANAGENIVLLLAVDYEGSSSWYGEVKQIYARNPRNLITKARIVYEANTAYLELYYNSSTGNYATFTFYGAAISNHMDDLINTYAEFSPVQDNTNVFSEISIIPNAGIEIRQGVYYNPTQAEVNAAAPGSTIIFNDGGSHDITIAKVGCNYIAYGSTMLLSGGGIVDNLTAINSTVQLNGSGWIDSLLMYDSEVTGPSWRVNGTISYRSRLIAYALQGAVTQVIGNASEDYLAARLIAVTGIVRNPDSIYLRGLDDTEFGYYYGIIGAIKITATLSELAIAAISDEPAENPEWLVESITAQVDSCIKTYKLDSFKGEDEELAF